MNTMVVAVRIGAFTGSLFAGVLGATAVAGEPSSSSTAEPSGFVLRLDEDAEDEASKGPWGEILDAVTGGKVSADLRARAEIVTQDGADRSNAYTERLRLGYRTGTWRGFDALVEFEDTRAIRDPLYNAAGLGGTPRRAVVADPESTELNQAYLQYLCEDCDTIMRGGRQRVVLDDARYVGNVGWRQNEQTYDAFLAQNTSFEDLTFSYAYIEGINTIFGEDSGRNLDSDSHVFHASYVLPEGIGTLTGYVYSLRVPTANVVSSDTYGLRFHGSRELDEDKGLGVRYTAEWAQQEDGRSNPLSFRMRRHYLNCAVTMKDKGALGGAYERLGSDAGRVGFFTPLATLHAWNGWADAFLATPANGLEDFWLYADASLPYGLKGQIRYHWFYEERGDDNLGREFNASVGKKWGDHFDALVKYAYFDGSRGFADRAKGWFQVGFKF